MANERPTFGAAEIAGMCAAAFVIGLWVYWQDAYGMTPESRPGEFGDWFGAITSLFSGLAFVGVFYAVFLQRREIGIMQQEMHAVGEAHRQSMRLDSELKKYQRIVDVLGKLIVRLERIRGCETCSGLPENIYEIRYYGRCLNEICVHVGRTRLDTPVEPTDWHAKKLCLKTVSEAVEYLSERRNEDGRVALVPAVLDILYRSFNDYVEKYNKSCDAVIRES